MILSHYENSKAKMDVQCPEGHTYKVSWNSFQQGCRCPECYKQNIQPDLEAIKKSFEQEGLEVSTTFYKNNHTKFNVRCSKGHTFQTTWGRFQTGYRCPYCSKKRITHQQVKDYIEQQGYKLLSEYKRSLSKIQVECPKGHKYQVTWANFHTGYRCPYCAGRVVTYDQVKSYIESQGYVLASEDYKNSSTHLQIRCPKGHQYKSTWNNFRQGYRCPKCFPRQSKNEKRLIEGFSGFNVIESDHTVLRGRKELDLYFPDHQVAIEYCGLYWHSDQRDNMTSSYHRDKLDQCRSQNIRLLTIFEDEWLNHKDICISRINNALGIVDNKIYARSCEARQIDKKEAKEFLNRCHLQGYGRCKLAFGLYHKDALVQVMTFGSPARAHTAKGKRVLELKRLASALDTLVVGGASKLFKLGLKYAREHQYDFIKSYCDLRWGTGNLYKKLGFTKTYETKYTPHYTDGVNRYRNQSLAQNKNKTGTTEAEVAMEKGLWKIYDCGHSTWEYEIK